MQSLILTAHLLLALVLICLVLLQHGKGAEAGAALSGNPAATVFGSKGSGNFLTKATILVACLLAATSISLSLLAAQKKRSGDMSISQSLQQSSYSDSIPAAPVAEE